MRSVVLAALAAPPLALPLPAFAFCDPSSVNYFQSVEQERRMDEIERRQREIERRQRDAERDSLIRGGSSW